MKLSDEHKVLFTEKKERGKEMGVSVGGYGVGFVEGVKERIGAGRLMALAMIMLLVMAMLLSFRAGVAQSAEPLPYRYGEPTLVMNVVATPVVIERAMAAKETVDSPYADAFQKTAEEFDLPVNVLVALAMVESAMNTNAVSQDGAGSLGLGQFIPSTWSWVMQKTGKSWSLKDRADPVKSVWAMGWYLDWIRAYVGKPGMTERNIVIKMYYGYNAGPANAKWLKDGNMPAYRRSYLERLLRLAGY